MTLHLCLQIAYHEKLVMPIEYSGSLENTIGRHHHFVTMTVVLTPNSIQKRFSAAAFKGEEINDCFNNPGSWQVKAVNSGIKTALSYGRSHHNSYTLLPLRPPYSCWFVVVGLLFSVKFTGQITFTALLTTLHRMQQNLARMILIKYRRS